MIRISLGNVGSGKTASEVKEMAENPTRRIYYSNIKTKLAYVRILKPQYIVKKELIGQKGEKPIYDYKVNLEFWQKIKEPLSIVLDESHNIADSRNSMSPVNRAVTSWQSAIRRIMGQTEAGYGELVYITQLLYSIDVRIREIATQIRYHICHYTKSCKKCGAYWSEHSDMPEVLNFCPICKSYELKRQRFIIEIFKFTDIQAYEKWKLAGQKTYFSRYFIVDIEKYFPLYDTLQWENLFENY